MKTEPLNLILYGPPGTGKTYSTVDEALRICDGDVLPGSQAERVARFNALREANRVEMVTFHQSFSYEEFVEGIRPILANDGETDAPEGGDASKSVNYECRTGVFKKIAGIAMNSGSDTAKRSAAGYDFDESQIRFWKMSLGRYNQDQSVFDECVTNNYLLLGYGEGLDFAGCANREQVLDKCRAVKHEISKNDYNVTSIDLFKNRMSVGDIVIISEGLEKFRAIGKITGDYHCLRPGEEYAQCRKVEWLAVFEEGLPRESLFRKGISQMTLYEVKVKNLKLDALREFIAPRASDEPLPHVLIIDEINRGNISKIFGELITLLEPDKRLGALNEIKLTLPYSGDSFGVPSNLYVIGTMNTADRSIALMDTALRRRFEFRELMPDPDVIKTSEYPKVKKDGKEIDLASLLAAMNRRIEILFDRERQIGHSYLLGITSFEELELAFRHRIIPLLQEYFHEDWEKIQMIFADLEPGSSEFDTRKVRDNAIIKCLPSSETDKYLLGILGDELQGKRSYRVSDHISPESIIKIYQG